MALRARLRKFFIVGCYLNQKLNSADYLSGLTDNDESNYKLFEKFSRECSSTLLCIMHKLGHCDGDEILHDVISRHLEVHQRFNHEEDDAGGYIADFLRRDNERERARGNYIVLPLRHELRLRRRAEEAPEGVPARRARMKWEENAFIERDISVIQLSSDDDDDDNNDDDDDDDDDDNDDNNGDDSQDDVPIEITSSADTSIFTPLRGDEAEEELEVERVEEEAEEEEEEEEEEMEKKEEEEEEMKEEEEEMEEEEMEEDEDKNDVTDDEEEGDNNTDDHDDNNDDNDNNTMERDDEDEEMQESLEEGEMREEEEEDRYDPYEIEVQSGGGRTSGSLADNAQSSVENNTEQQHRPVQQEEQEEEPQEEEQQRQHQPRQQEQQQQYSQQQHRVHRFNFIDLLAENTHRFANFRIFGREARFAIRPPAEGTDTVRWLENAFREIHTFAIDLCEPNDYVGLSFNSEDLTRGPAGLSFRPARDLTPKDIWGLVSSVAQSAGGINVAEYFTIRVFNVAVPAGRGGVSNRLTHENVPKRSILQLDNTDNLCLPRSLVLARIYCERGNLRTGELHDKWKSARRRNSSLQRKLALELTRRAGITIPEKGCGIPEIKRFQKFLAAENIALMIYNSSTFGRGEKPLYDGCALLASLKREPALRLNIMYYECSRHYNPILNLKAAAGTRGKYCVACNVGYCAERDHRCAKKCPRCYGTPSCERSDAENIKCKSCNRTFFGNTCFERHRAEKSYDNKTTVCNAVNICNDCRRFIKTSARHKCGIICCQVCRSRQPANHFCFMQPLRRKIAVKDPGEGTSAAAMREVTHGNENNVVVEDGEKEKRRSKKNRVAFVFYDFETRQDEILEGTDNIKIHVPTFCVAQQICETCANTQDMSARCRWCRVREFVFWQDPVKQFVDFATRTTKCFKKIICITHNAKAFDAQFILKYLVEKSEITQAPQIILNGTKIVEMTVGHTKFIDSLNYMPMHLSDLPKAFGLQDTSDKGIFPHLFNTRENQEYVGPLPDARYYSPEQMKPEERERFLTWHAEMTRENAVFDFQYEIIKYYRNNVNILRRACMAFRDILLERGNVCPFEECTTIASTCMKVFRKNFLRKEEIGVIPPGGYRMKDKHSRKALQWMMWMERQLDLPIIHAGRGREYRIGSIPVDGYYEIKSGNATQRHVLQFHGCFWHGCPDCFDISCNIPLSSTNHGDTFNMRYERTVITTWWLRKQGYHVTEKWECVFDREIRENHEMRDFVENHAMLNIAPLDPRDALFDNRTENIATHCEVTGTEKIRYLNVCSLYPYVLKTGTFPIGHPDIFIGEECSALIGEAPNYDFDSVEGLVRCRVLPPRDLFHPVLPYRVRGELLFPLCRSCCETFSQTACTHDQPTDREFEGTWVSCELRKAIEKGYLVTNVNEIWQYKVARYVPGTRQRGLFSEYINTFLQLKQEASGWPSECENDEIAKERYLWEYKETEGVVLDRNSVARNPGLRSVAKLCLNSFWGKFGQQTNLPNTEIVKSYQQLATLLTNPKHEITDILPVNNEVIYVSWRLREETIVPSPLMNVVIAAYTTAQARLKLYSHLELLDRRVLYYDTDSCIYLSTGVPNELEPPTGNFLGDMTDKLESYGRGSYIESFVSEGPKFYAYVIRTPEGRAHEICKIKGITLNYKNSLIVNFNSIRKLIIERKRREEEREEETETAGSAINLHFTSIRHTAFHVTRGETKSCTPVLVKRRFINNRYSFPYGFVE